MRAPDRKHPSHEDVHVRAQSDDELKQTVRQHITEAHPK